jgi:hypothetical protein
MKSTTSKEFWKFFLIIAVLTCIECYGPGRWVRQPKSFSFLRLYDSTTGINDEFSNFPDRVTFEAFCRSQNGDESVTLEKLLEHDDIELFLKGEENSLELVMGIWEEFAGVRKRISISEAYDALNKILSSPSPAPPPASTPKETKSVPTASIEDLRYLEREFSQLVRDSIGGPEIFTSPATSTEGSQPSIPREKFFAWEEVRALIADEMVTKQVNF